MIVSSLLFYPMPRADGWMAPVHGMGWTLNFEMFFYVMFAAVLALPRGLAVGALTTIFVLFIVLGARLDGMDSRRARDRVVRLFGCERPRGAHAGMGRAERNAAMLVAAVTLSWTTSTPTTWASNRAGAFAILLGDASYSLYLVHPLVLAVASTFAPCLGFSSRPWLALVLMIVGSIMVSIMTYNRFERPITRWLQRGAGSGTWRNPFGPRLRSSAAAAELTPGADWQSEKALQSQ